MNKTFNYRNIEVNLIKTNKFKSILVDATFEGEFSKETISDKCLLHLVLENSNRFYKTKEEVINKAFELYNAVVDVNISVNHQIIATTFSLDIIDYKLINKPDMQNEALDFYHNFVFEPDIYDGKFNEDVFNEKKKAIIDSINKRYNNKGQYAVRKMLENMCKGELLEIPVTGTIEDINKITPESLYQTYLKLLNERLRITITGFVSEDEAKRIVDGFLGSYDYKYLDSGQSLSPYQIDKIKVNEIKHTFEEQDINQSRLVMGFRTNINAVSNYAQAIQIFNIMFGGIYSSNLYQKVREELSLAYSIYSDCYLLNQLMLVCAGVDEKSLSKVEKVVLDELKKYQDGIIDEEIFNQAKTFAISDIERLDDSNYSLSSYYYKQRLLGTNYSPSELYNKFMSVTIEDIINVSKLIQLDTVFFLKGVKKND